MERLTERDEFGNANIIEIDNAEFQLNLDFDDFNRVTNALNKLAKYEDLEEQGKLLKLPCEIGSEVWYIDAYEGKHSAKIVRGTVDGYSWFRSCGFALNVLFDEPIMGHFAYKRKEMPFIEIGKTIFLLKPEAEVALQKMNETEGSE